MTVSYTPTPLSDVKSRFEEAMYDPTLLIHAGLETIQQVTNGEGLLLDPTHPAVTILEMGAVESANAVQNTIGLLRMQYPSLAESVSDLYRHMSSNDYLNRFATPSTTTITVAILVADIFSKLIEDVSEGCWKAVIPRDTRFTVDGHVFSLCYPVVIRRYNTGVVQIAYDTSIESPLQTLKEVVITPKVRTSGNREDWMFIELDVVQVDRTIFNAVIDRVYNFQKNIPFTDQFHYARAFYRNNLTGNAWVEIQTTHSDQVFDPRTPTILLQVQEGSLDVKIPIIYISNRSISGELRVDIFTTKGELQINLQNYSTDLFGVNMQPIDEERDYNAYANAFTSIAYYAYGTEYTVGGKSSISFEMLRKRVIYGAVGPQVIPITPVDLEASGINKAYNIVRDVDVVTNRIYLATRKLPPPSNPRLITPANIGIITYSGSLDTLLTSPSVIMNHNRYTIKSRTLFKRENGISEILDSAQVQRLRSLPQNQFVGEVNQNNYLYNPFYYVLDEEGNEFDMRVYSLDQPHAKDLSFIRLNQSLQLPVNTASFSFEKVATGYKLTIKTNSGTYFKEAEDSHVGVQLAFYPYGENVFAYINGSYVGKDENNERIYEFNIETNHDLDKNDLICITNARVRGVDGYQAWIELSTTFNLMYHTTLTTTNFEADETDQLLGKFILPTGSVGNSREEITLVMGSALSSLWRRARSYFHDTVYKTYDTDVPLLYSVDTYEKDPITGATFNIVNGEIVYNQLHRQGDPVLNKNGEPLYLHRKGDVVLDLEGNPVTITKNVIGRELDLLVVDGRYVFADDEATVTYLHEVEKVITSWVTVDMVEIEANLLEKTKIFYYPKSNIGEVLAYYEGSNETRTNSEQEFSLVLYVEDGIFRNDKIRSDIELRTVRLLDRYIDRTVVNMSEIRDELKKLYGDSVKAFTITGLGDQGQYEILSMKDDRYRLSLKKELVIRADMRMYVRDAVNFEFKRSV